MTPETPTTSALDQATHDDTQMGQSQNTQSGDGSVASQQEMFKVILDMRVSGQGVHAANVDGIPARDERTSKDRRETEQGTSKGEASGR